MNKIGKEKAVELINNSKGRFITVTFITKNNKTRTMNCVKSKKTKDKLGYLTVKEVGGGYKNVNSQTISELKLDKTSYKIG